MSKIVLLAVILMNLSQWSSMEYIIMRKAVEKQGKSCYLTV